jgi:hypothetical protein
VKLKINPQWHFLAFVAAAVVVGLRAGAILEHGAWAGGSETVTGRIDDIQASRKIRVVRYSYQVDGKPYTGEITDRNAFIENVPATVTYAKSNPAVSTLQPEKIESIYITSLIVAGVGLLPMVLMWLIELKHRLGRKAVPIEETAA